MNTVKGSYIKHPVKKEYKFTINNIQFHLMFSGAKQYCLYFYIEPDMLEKHHVEIFNKCDVGYVEMSNMYRITYCHNNLDVVDDLIKNIVA